MIKKNEIRLGNVIASQTFESRVTFPWTVYESDMVEMYSKEKWDRYTGIELTNKWLISLGFENIWGDRWNYKDVELLKDDGKYFLIIEERTNFSKYYLYVHELQNLVFALTGEELVLTAEMGIKK